MIPSRVNDHIQRDYAFFARGAYLDVTDGHVKVCIQPDLMVEYSYLHESLSFIVSLI